MKGYHGRILEVDLSARKMKDMSISEEFFQKYIGGATLAAALVYERLKKGIHPLAPENALVLATGPDTIRAVTHLNVSVAEIDTALALINEILNR